MGLSLISCKKNDEKPVEVEKKIINKSKKELIENHEETKISINSINDFPPEIDGAACYFSVDRGDFEKESYVYVDDVDSISYVKIKDKLVRFKMTEDNGSEGSLNHYSKRFTSEEYELFIDLKKTKEFDEKPILEGHMIIKDKNKSETKVDLYGICGC